MGNKEEGSMIPRCREPSCRIQYHKLQVNEELTTMNMAVQVLVYTSRKWIVDPKLVKVQPEWHICIHENTWLRKVSWNPLQWTCHDLYEG